MSRRSHRSVVAAGLASAFLAGVWTELELVGRARIALGRRHRWLVPLARQVMLAYHRPPLDRGQELAEWIDANATFQGAWYRARRDRKPTVRRWLPFEAEMGATRWPVPQLPGVGDLGEFLGLDPCELAWFADRRSMERSVVDEPLRHYRYQWVTKASGGVRLLEAPKLRMRDLQRRLLHEIVDWIPAHPAAHGFVAGRSVLTFVDSHVGTSVLIKLDLEDFFGSVNAGRVFGIFRGAGYPEAVAHTLSALTTNVVPRAVWHTAPRPGSSTSGSGFERHYRMGRRLTIPHLPQGAPTSPALANLCAHRLDRRIAGLADSFGVTYSRYADDIALSGPVSARTVARMIELVTEIATNEGFMINEMKTRAVTNSQRQRLAGVVINERPNMARLEYDTLRAVLHNAARHGLESENRAGHPDFAAHLAGRVSWAVALNPGRRVKLEDMLAHAIAPR